MSHYRSTDVRIPATIAEGELALRVIDEKVENIDASIAQRTEHGIGCDSVKAARRSWTQRRVEIEYAMVLLRSGGASPLEAENAELRAKVASFNKRIEDLNRVIHEQRERLKAYQEKRVSA